MTALMTPGCARLAVRNAVDEPLTIAADAETLTLRFGSGVAGTARVLELRPYEHLEAAADRPAVWEGHSSSGPVRLPRLSGSRDRLFSRFQFLELPSETPLGTPVYATDMSSFTRRGAPFVWPESKKGLSGIVDLDDLIALGVKYPKDNISLRTLLVQRGSAPFETWMVDGHPYRINMNTIHRLDRTYRKLTRAGMSISVVILNHLPRERIAGDVLIHPATDVENAPNHLGAFNLTDEEGLRAYRACLEFLANRYSDPDGEHGCISSYIIGNEIQAHWHWHNAGRMPKERVLREYTTALRVAWLSIRQFSPDARIYNSMTHGWDYQALVDDRRCIKGTDVVELMTKYSREEGDFPWRIGFHPYPEDLLEPRFWNDRRAVWSLDTPMITFKNLEVLAAYMRQPRLLYRGKPRSILLCEQGFHCPDTPAGETWQAAAFAYAWHKVRNMPEIDAFQLNRHVDNRLEGSLRNGLWTEDPDALRPLVPKRKRPIYEAFRVADAPDWRSVFDQYLPVLGFDTWDQALPSRAPIPGTSAEAERLRKARNRRTEKRMEIDGWRNNDQCELYAEDGVLRMECINRDPQMIISGLSIAAPARIRLRLRGRATGAGMVYWATEGQPGFVPEHAAPFDLEHDGRWFECIAQIHAKGRITKLRVDPAKGIGTVWVDWIRVEPVASAGAAPMVWEFDD